MLEALGAGLVAEVFFVLVEGLSGEMVLVLAEGMVVALFAGLYLGLSLLLTAASLGLVTFLRAHMAFGNGELKDRSFAGLGAESAFAMASSSST